MNETASPQGARVREGQGILPEGKILVQCGVPLHAEGLRDHRATGHMVSLTYYFLEHNTHCGSLLGGPF